MFYKFISVFNIFALYVVFKIYKNIKCIHSNQLYGEKACKSNKNMGCHHKTAINLMLPFIIVIATNIFLQHLL